jgi:hypothetical protein
MRALLAGGGNGRFSAMNSPPRIVTTPEKVRLRVEDFLLLNEQGAFSEHSRTELIDGDIYFINAQHSRPARIETEMAP